MRSASTSREKIPRSNNTGTRGKGREDSFLSENKGRNNWSKSSEAVRKNRFPLEQIMAIKDTTQMTLRLTSHLAAFEDFINTDYLPPEVSISVLKILNQVSSCEFQGGNAYKIVQKVCTSRFIDTHLALVIRELQSSDMSEERVVEVVEMIHIFLSTICLKHPSYASKAFLPLSVLTTHAKITTILKKSKPILEDDLKKLLAESNDCMEMLHKAVHTKDKSRFRRGFNEDDETPPEDFVKLPIFPEDRDMEWSEKPFLR